VPPAPDAEPEEVGEEDAPEEDEEDEDADDEDMLLVLLVPPAPGWLAVGALELPLLLLEPQPAQRAPAAAARPTRAWRRVAPPQSTISEGVV
jgi:hypothetical protein